MGSEGDWKDDAIDRSVKYFINRLMNKETTTPGYQANLVSEFRQRWGLVFDKLVTINSTQRCTVVESVNITLFTSCVIAPLMQGDKCFKARWGYRHCGPWANAKYHLFLHITLESEEDLRLIFGDAVRVRCWADSLHRRCNNKPSRPPAGGRLHIRADGYGRPFLIEVCIFIHKKQLMQFLTPYQPTTAPVLRAYSDNAGQVCFFEDRVYQCGGTRWTVSGRGPTPRHPFHTLPRPAPEIRQATNHPTNDEGGA